MQSLFVWFSWSCLNSRFAMVFAMFVFLGCGHHWVFLCDFLLIWIFDIRIRISFSVGHFGLWCQQHSLRLQIAIPPSVWLEVKVANGMIDLQDLFGSIFLAGFSALAPVRAPLALTTSMAGWKDFGSLITIELFSEVIKVAHLVHFVSYVVSSIRLRLHHPSSWSKRITGTICIALSLLSLSSFSVLSNCWITLS